MRCFRSVLLIVIFPGNFLKAVFLDRVGCFIKGVDIKLAVAEILLYPANFINFSLKFTTGCSSRLEFSSLSFSGSHKRFPHGPFLRYGQIVDG